MLLRCADEFRALSSPDTLLERHWRLTACAGVIVFAVEP